MTVLKIYRGVPASGKSTEAANSGAVVVNRDSIRFMMFGKYWGVDEGIITDAENAMIESSLRAGNDTIVDATNLVTRHLRTKLSIAARHGATVEYVDFPIDLATAIERDAQRERKVGSEVIEGFFRRAKIDPWTGILPKPPEPLPMFEKYVGNPNLPLAYIVDTDGTVANHEPHRSPYDTSQYHKDTPIEHVANIVDGLYEMRYNIIGLSGRDETFRDVTTNWWRDKDIPFTAFFMRPAGDKRMDALVKYDLFKEHIEPHYNVLAAFDDRPQVIRMWETIGVPVLNVADGREF